MHTRFRMLIGAALLLPALACSKGGEVVRDERTDAAAPHITVDLSVRDTAPAATDAPVDSAGSCDHALPAGWPAGFSVYRYNPILRPTSASPNQGADNIYAPDIHPFSGAKVMWYGAQGSDGHDRIYLAWSRDGMAWSKWPSDGAPAPVLERGASNHVNDPSVVRSGDTWRMYYTDAPTAENDEIWLAESTKLTAFTKVQRVLDKGPAGAWDEEKVGRPSVLYEGGVYRMWYDGTSKGRRHVGLATSMDGVHFTRAPQNPVFLDAGAIDVKRVGGTLVMLREAGDGTYFATSTDGICWIDRGKLFGLSGSSYDRYGQVTPFLEVDGGTVLGVWFGGASVATWNKNRVAAAFPLGTSPSGGGCTECVTPGLSCSAACVNGGAGAVGVCAAPGSTSPGACCNCQPSGCEACTTKGDCQAACVGIGKAGGWCAYPGSTTSGRCCACIE